ncbi:hypothetical protein C8Q73DRAFT_365450 [Cubamyces lactineus]|nr:hypothetical protein C8Q73DRAFT_365450 [Cubamyces lactineus]
MAHVLTISVQEETISHVLFDYLIYTADGGRARAPVLTNSPHADLPLACDASVVPSIPFPDFVNAAIRIYGRPFGGVIGGIAVLVLAGVQLFWLCKRHQHRVRQIPSTPSLALPPLPQRCAAQNLSVGDIVLAQSAVDSEHPDTDQSATLQGTDCYSRSSLGLARVPLPEEFHGRPNADAMGDRSSYNPEPGADVIRIHVAELIQKARELSRLKKAQTLGRPSRAAGGLGTGRCMTENQDSN